MSLYFLSTAAWAAGPIFSCVDARGQSAISFQDRPCAVTQNQRVLENVDTYPIMSLVAIETNPLEALAVAQEKARAYKKEEAARKKEKRLAVRQARQAKQFQEARLRAERRQLRCQSTLKTIQTIETRLRHGAKISQVQRLREQLKEAQIKKERYCSVETT